MGRSFVLALLAAFGALVRGEVVVVTGENYDSVVDGSSNVLLEFYAPWCGHCKKLAPEYDILGSQFTAGKDGVVIAKVDAQEHQALGAMFGVTGYPTLKWMPKGKSAPGDAEDVKAARNAEALSAFVSNKAGIKNKGPSKAPSAVVDLTMQTFDSVVMDPSKHVLVEFFAPWCGHCKKLAPIYEQLGNVFAAEGNVVIAKVDADSEKELGSRFGVSGFPTIKFFPTGDEDPETYNGGRDLKGFVDFINSKAGTSRNMDGGLNSSAGRLVPLDKILETFASSGAGLAELGPMLEDGVAKGEFTSEADKSSAGHYTRAAKKLAERGSSYISTELKRLDGLMGGSVSPQKKTLFMVRTNILKAFEEAGVGKEAAPASPSEQEL